MHRSRIATLALALLTAGTLAVVGLTNPAGAEVPTGQKVSLRDESPESGLHSMAFRNYGEKEVCQGSRKYGTYWCGYRVTKGKVLTKISTYKLDEGRPDYDYFLVDVDMTVNRSGSSHWGWAHAILTTKKGTKIVDTRETGSVKANKNSCASVDLSLTTPWPGLAGSIDLGSVRFCSDEAAFTRHVRTPKMSEYKANRMGKTNHLSIQRWVKVPEGKRPSFRLKLELPRDTCTKVREKVCVGFTNGGAAKTYGIGTKY